MSNEYLALKWGTIKGYNFTENPAALEKLEEIYAEGVSHSAMLQDRTKTHIELLCELVDLTNGRIYSDWTGEDFTKEEAKKYLLEYSKN